MGVVHRGGVARAQESGAVLAVAPDHWTDGCPVLVERRPEGGPPVVTRSYLDPATGSILYAEVALAEAPRGFASQPHHWTNGSTGAASAE
jgi:N-methylhydantoinase B